MVFVNSFFISTEICYKTFEKLSFLTTDRKHVVNISIDYIDSVSSEKVCNKKHKNLELTTQDRSKSVSQTSLMRWNNICGHIFLYGERYIYISCDFFLPIKLSMKTSQVIILADHPKSEFIKCTMQLAQDIQNKLGNLM